MYIHKKLALTIAFALLVSIPACNKDKDTGSKHKSIDVSSLVGPDFLKYIPADSPFVIVGYEPIPAELIEKSGEIYKFMPEYLKQKVLNEDLPAPQKELFDELIDNLSIKGFENYGVKLSTRFAFYALGGSLVLRMELLDGDKLNKLIARASKAVGENIPTAKLADTEYYRVLAGEALIVFFVGKKEFVAAVMPAGLEKDIMPYVLNQKKPAKSIVDSGKLKKIIGQYGFKGYMPGFIDSKAMVDFFSGNTDLSKKSLKALGIDFEMTPICQTEFMQLAKVIPSMIFGYYEFSAKRLNGMAMINIRNDIAKELIDLQAPVPLLANLHKHKPMIAFGSGMDAKKTIHWFKQQVAKIAAKPYQCPILLGINEAAKSSAKHFASLPPIATGFRGTVVIANKFKMTDKMPEVGGYALLNHQDPMALVAMAKSIPALANIEIKPNGEPVKITLPLPIAGDVYVAVKDNQLGLSLGQEAEKVAMLKALELKAEKAGPAFAISYDYGRIFESMAPRMAGMGGMEANFINTLKNFGLLTEAFYFTDQGLQLDFLFDLN